MVKQKRKLTGLEHLLSAVRAHCRQLRNIMKVDCLLRDRINELADSLEVASDVAYFRQMGERKQPPAGEGEE